MFVRVYKTRLPLPGVSITSVIDLFQGADISIARTNRLGLRGRNILHLYSVHAQCRFGRGDYMGFIRSSI
jgi:hypothetical protein